MFDHHYVNWRKSRVDGIKKYIDLSFFKEKTMLEVGCGYADLGNIFSEFSCSVTSTDARKEHLDIVKER
jgi:2-polyprenyl-3-methyl-5-hydroxy-6-metoxy-1,4-benzoquinol methylase